MNPDSEYQVDDMLAHVMDERDCLLLDDPASVERLAAAIRAVRRNPQHIDPDGGFDLRADEEARAIIEALRGEA